MSTCNNCGKENLDHYKFCLGCGSKLEAVTPVPASGPPAAGAPPRPSPTQPSGLGGSPTVPGGPTTCTACGLQNPEGFAFCGRCGNKLQSTVPAAVVAPVVPSRPAPAQPAPSSPPDVGSARTVFADDEPPSQPPAPQHSVKLIMLGSDGQPVGERMLSGEAMHVGRDLGAPWDDDAYLDPEHATLTPTSDGLTVKDAGSLNGVFFRLEGRVDLRDGDVFRVGQELLAYEDLPEPAPAPDGTERMGSPNPGYWGRVKLIVEPGRASAAWPIESDTFTVGRESGDVSFPEDGYVSGTHCRVFGDDNGVYLEDLGSSNGTYVRVRSGDSVPFGRTVLIGQRLFRIERPQPA